LDDGQGKPFQLLFFTGVRYERHNAQSFAFSNAALPVKRPTRKKLAKA
jgi:hypothetical protein